MLLARGAALCESRLRGKTANPATAAKRGAWGDLTLRLQRGETVQAQAKRGCPTFAKATVDGGRGGDRGK